MKDKIAALVAQNRLKEAIALLPMNESIMLRARLTNLEKQETMGTISYDDATMNKNRIVAAILSFAGVDSSSYAPQQVQQKPQYTIEGELMSIIRQNKRRREDIAGEARDLLSKLQAYNNEKALSTAYDPSGRRYHAIKQSFERLKLKLTEAKGDAIEDIVARIKSLLPETTIPTYDQLNEAYRLACGRGMRSDYADRTLNSRPDDDDARITVAEKIEAFIETIHVS